MSSRVDAFVRKYAEFAIDKKWLVFVLVAIVGAGACLGLPRLAFDTRYRIWFEDDAPALASYDELVARFGGDDQALVVFGKNGQNLMNNQALGSIRRLTDGLWKVKGVKRVDSLANFALIRGSRAEHESPALAASASYIAAAGDKNEVLVWDTTSWKQRTFRGHSGLVEHLVISADGKSLFSGGVDRTVRVWNLESGELQHTLRGHGHGVSVLELSRDGRRLYAGAYGALFVWDVATRKRMHKFEGHADYVTAIAESPDGARLYSASQNLHVWDLKTGKRVVEYSSGGGFFNGLVIDKAGTRLVSAADDGRISLWSTKTGARTDLAPASEIRALAVRFSPDETLAIGGMSDGSIRAYPVNGEPPIVSRVHTDWAVDLQIAADGQVYSASRDRNVARHTPGEGPKIVHLAAHRAAVRRVLLAPGGRLLTLGDDGDVYVWNVNELSMQARLHRVSEPPPEAPIPQVGPPVGKLVVANGFRFPVEIRIGGSRVAGSAHGGKLLKIERLPVPESKACEDDSECADGQYCDYEQDEPACVGQTSIEGFLPGTQVRVWSGQAFLQAGKSITVRMPSDEPFSVSEAADTPDDERATIGGLKKVWSHAAIDEALRKIYGPDASDPDVFITSDDASELENLLRGKEGVPPEAVNFISTHAQSKLSAWKLPVQPYRLREADYHLMRPPVPLAKGTVLNEARDTTMILVNFHDAKEAEGTQRAHRIRADIEKLLAAEVKETGYEYHLLGGLIMDTWMEQYAKRDTEKLLPLFFGVIALLLVLVYRRLSGVILPLGLVTVSIIIATGASGLLGASLNNMTVAVPQVILASCIGDAVHIFNAYVDRVRVGETPREATINAITANFMPCLWTSLSTAIGFFSLASSAIVPVAMFGWMAGIGVVTAFAMSMTIMPAVTSLLPVPKRDKDAKESPKEGGFDAWVDARMVGIANYVNSSPGTITALSIVMLGFAVYGLTKVEIDTNSLKFFAEQAPFRKSAEYVEDTISGSYGLQLMVDFGEKGGVRKVEYLEPVARLQEQIEKSPEVRNVTSITDTLKSMNRIMNHDVNDNFRLPNTDAKASSYYNAYTFSLRAGMDITNRVSSDESSTLIDVRLNNHPAVWTLAWGNELVRWAEANLENVKVTVAAKSWLYTNLVKDVAEGFLANVGSAVLLISIMLLFLARSFHLGLPACMANVVPIMATVGAIGYAGVSLDISVLVSCCVALGVVVDDTTHFVSKYRRQRDKGASHDEAVVATIREAGKAMVFTSIILVLGFMMLTFTDFAVNRNFGYIVSVMLSLGALFDLTVLPTAIKLFQPKEARGEG